MRRQRDRAIGGGALGVAGWLFAELALILAVVVLGSETPAPTTAAEEAPPPTTSTSVPPPGAPEGLSLSTAKFRMFVAPGGAGVADTFRTRLDETVGADARVGLILLFGVSRTSNPLGGTAVSQQLRQAVVGAGIPQLKSTVDIRPYLGDRRDGEPGEVLVELFLLNGPA